MMIKYPSKAGARRGKVTVLVALSLAMIMGAAALTLDGGLLVSERRQAQSVADAASLAGAYSLYSDYYNNRAYNIANARAAANSMAYRNGYYDSSFQVGGLGGSPMDDYFGNIPATSNAHVVVNCPPLSGPFLLKPGYIEVILTSNQSNHFSSIWSNSGLSVTARAVARGTVIQTANASIILLDPSKSGALTVVGSAKVVSGGGIAVNSSSSTAAIANNSGSATTPSLSIVGNNTTSSGGSWNATVINGASAVVDPLASIVQPNPTTLGLTNQPSPPGYGSFTIQPGVYNGGVTFGGGSQVTMAPGIYYMKSGSFTVANGVTITGAGVMIYIDNGGGSLSFQGGGNITLSPLTSGIYAGISIFQDRTSSVPINIANGTTTAITGSIYAAGAPVSFAGGASYNQSASQIIAATLNVSNNAYVGVSGGSGSVSSKKAIGLVQ